MRFPVRWLWLAVAAVLVLFVAAACDDNGDDGDQDGEPTAATEEPMDGDGDADEVATDFGVTDTEIVLGQTTALSGAPEATVFSVIPPAIEAYFSKVNQEDDGVCGRQIRFIVEDDQYAPAPSLERARKLAEQDEVLAYVGNLGTAAVTGHVDFVNDPNGDGDTSDGIPHLFLSTGASKWNNPEQWPWTIGYIPDYMAEGQVIAQTLNEMFPGESAAILYQNDDFGENGRSGFLEAFEGEIVAEESYEVGTADVTSQMANIRAADPDIVFFYSLPLTTAQAVRFMEENNWHPEVAWSYVNPNTLMAGILGGGGEPEQIEAGNQLIAGAISTNYILDPVANADDPAIVEHVRIMETYGGPAPAQLSVYGQTLAELAVEALNIACENGDMTRAGVLAAAESIQGYRSDLHLEGIEINLGPDDHVSLEALVPVELQEDGTLAPLGEVVDVEE